MIPLVDGPIQHTISSQSYGFIISFIHNDVHQ